MSAQSEIIAKYGPPGPEYLSKFCELWQIDADFPWFPAKRIFINSDFKAKWEVALPKLFEADVHTEIQTFDGCYAERNVRGRSVPSLHSWAMAWDLNAATERLGQTTTNWSSDFIDIVTAAGIYWGGNFIHRKDPMHFAHYDG